MRKFEVISEEIEVLRMIDKLRIDDVKDENITVVYKEGFKHNTARYSEVNFRQSDGNLWDRFLSKINDNDAENTVFTTLDLTESELKEYIGVVDEGKFLVFVEGYDAVKEAHPEQGAPVNKAESGNEHSETTDGEDLGQILETKAHDLKAVETQSKKIKFAPKTDQDTKSDEGVTIDMRQYVVTQPGLEPEIESGTAQSHDGHKKTTSSEDTLSGIKGTRPLREVPENPDYTVKDNVVDLSNK